tara:strand:- start:931 stop:1827 length:897 start_codon:yes stop_codon:yes gene_type:complete
MADDNKIFDSTLYGGSLGDNSLPPYSDFSDAYANNKGAYITFQHESTGKSVSFKAFIVSFTETFASDWSEESVFGRADPIYLFKQTRRSVSLSFVAPAASSGEAYENLGKIQKLAQFLYPTYANVQEAQTISQSPLVRLKVMNLLSQNGGDKFPYGATLYDPAGTTQERESPTKQYSGYVSAAGGAQGLLGVIKDITFNHNLQGDAGVIDPAPGVILPKLLEVNLSFNVIHEHPVGWNEEGSFGAATAEEEEASTAPEAIEDAAADVVAVAAAADEAQDAADANQDAQHQNVLGGNLP